MIVIAGNPVTEKKVMSLITAALGGREEGEFLLVIAGSIRFAPYLTGWRRFKDHIREIVEGQPGWVDVYASQSQRREEMQGWARLKSVGDADAAYSRLLGKLSIRAAALTLS